MSEPSVASSDGEAGRGPVPPVLGRASPASSRPAGLRSGAEAASAAYRADGGDGPRWSVRAASVAGVRHRLAGHGPEDAYAWRVVEGAAFPGGPPPRHGPFPDGDDGGADPAGLGPGATDGGSDGAGRVGAGASLGPSRSATAILAVADGVGSVAGSAAAAAAAVSAVCDALVADLAASTASAGGDPVSAGGPPGSAGLQGSGGGRPGSTGGLPGSGGDADGAGPPGSAGGAGRRWDRVFAAADAAAAAAGGATTLVVAVIGPDGRGGVARVGDSTALVLNGWGWREVWPADAPDDGPVTTATAALPAAPRAVPVIDTAVVALGPADVLVLVTDGIANPLRDGPTTVAPALGEALLEPPSPLGLAVVADFSRQGCFDDRTVVGLWSGDRSGAN